MKNRFWLGSLLVLLLGSTSFAGDLSLQGRSSHGDRYERSHRNERRVTLSPRAPRNARNRWIAGYYKNVPKRVWIPARYERVWIEPVYETRYDECGEPYRVLVCNGYWKKVYVAGCYETRYVKVWMPGRWSRGYARF